MVADVVEEEWLRAEGEDEAGVVQPLGGAPAGAGGALRRRERRPAASQTRERRGAYAQQRGDLADQQVGAGHVVLGRLPGQRPKRLARRAQRHPLRVQRRVLRVHQRQCPGHVPLVHGPHDPRRRHRPVPLRQCPVRQQRPPVRVPEDPVPRVRARHGRQHPGLLVVADLLRGDTAEAGEVDGAQAGGGSIGRGHRVEG